MGRTQSRTSTRKTATSTGVWAESWEIVDHPEHSSLVSNGDFAGKSLRQLSETAPEWLYGPTNPTRSLPLLLKYLDCQRVLSVQVHPDDQQARALQPPDLGKTEAWYIVSATPDAVLYAGLKPGVTRDDLLAAVQAGEVESCRRALGVSRAGTPFR
jgi:mannose-6-phosphate isomerase